MRLLVARCEVLYTGRLTARLPEAVRLLMFKADGSFLVHDDAGGYRPLNWMTPPTVVEEEPGLLVVRNRAGKTEDRLEVRLLEVLSDVTHELDATPSRRTASSAICRRSWPRSRRRSASLCGSCGASGPPTSAQSI
jgi:RecB family endonuclease NucS